MKIEILSSKIKKIITDEMKKLLIESRIRSSIFDKFNHNKFIRHM